MGRLSRKRKRKAPPPPDQDIPEDFKKGVPVVYMLQRVTHKHCVFIDGVAGGSFKEREDFLHDLFSDKRFKMSPSKKKPISPLKSHVKFGISEDVHERVETINKGIFKTGTTEWFEVSNEELITASGYFSYWRHRTKIWTLITLLFLAFWVWVWWEAG